MIQNLPSKRSDRMPTGDPNSVNRLYRLFRLAIRLLMVLLMVPLANAQIAVRIPDPDKELSAGGMVRLTRTIPGSDAQAGKLVSREIREIWVATNDGIYIIDEITYASEKLLPSPSDIKKIFQIQGMIWLSTSQGIVRVDPSDRSLETILPAAELIDSAGIEGMTWLLTNQGAFSVDSNTTVAQPLQISTKDITCVSAIGNKAVWFGTEEGIYQANPDGQVTYVAGSPRQVQRLLSDRVLTWVVTKDGVYRFSSGVFDEVFDQRSVSDENSGKSVAGVTLINHANNLVWFVAGDTIYTITEGRYKKTKGSQSLDGVRFLATSLTNVYTGRINAGHLIMKTLGSNRSGISTIDMKAPREYQLGYEFWVGTDTGVYLFRNEQGPLKIPERNLQVNSMLFINGTPWIATDRGLFRVDRDTEIQFDVKSDSWWKSLVERLFGGKVRPEGIITPEPSYVRVGDPNSAGTDPYGQSFPREFRVIMDTNQNNFEAAQKRGQREYSLAKNIGKPLTWDTRIIFYDVLDKWDNRSNGRMYVTVLPGPVVLGGLFATAWTLSLILMIALAPRSSFCISLLMSRNIRRWGYFNLIPIVITVLPRVRLHVLRRYRDTLGQDKTLIEWPTNYVVPSNKFTAESSFEALKKHRKLLLIGQSGIGKTAYFKYLCAACLQNDSKEFKKITPLFLPLNRYRGAQPASMVHTQLANYGQLIDPEITESFLQQGGFLIFLDGLTEIDTESRNMLNTFVERHWLKNYFFMSSQEDYPEFAGQRLELEPLNRETIHELLKKRLPQDRADQVMNGLDDRMYDLYKVPQELELAIQLLIANPEAQLPRTRQELYEKRLHPVFEKWRKNEQSEYPEILTGRAYQMFKSKETFFDPEPQKTALPHEIKSDLLKAGLLVSRLNQLSFSHDQVRDFLTAKYFAARWRELIKQPDLIVDFNWQSTLRFAIGFLVDENEIRDLTLELIQKDKFLARDLFKWLNETSPQLTESWLHLFTRRLGEAVLR